MTNDDKEKGKPDKGFTLTVNGRERIVTEKKQSYRDIAKLAYPDANFDQFLYTITYFKGEGGHEGDLVEGEKINVQDGMVFNVRRSDKS
ncbi:multiubiquitin domain-containing protein [Sphingomonas sp. AR_OL41]|uniref:multiubiquitin domain-containing protein n=1 Tax=Sphingomonas sp. AR_OL41 TaxID=3042729 RepID=UPI00247FFFEC|nr:multiubiquitin domain-containing protein [Sphingomonas sp. AR_OL41]MDH7972516.1 multiubiquitin domain-containing protein [Sphingomonas sp. AR_OL41]